MLKKADIPSVKIIEEGAFQNCHALKRIRIPSSIKKIEQSTFQNCSLLQQVEFDVPFSVTSFEMYSFNGCDLFNQKIISKINSFN